MKKVKKCWVLDTKHNNIQQEALPDALLWCGHGCGHGVDTGMDGRVSTGVGPVAGTCVGKGMSTRMGTEVNTGMDKGAAQGWPQRGHGWLMAWQRGGLGAEMDNSVAWGFAQRGTKAWHSGGADVDEGVYKSVARHLAQSVHSGGHRGGQRRGTGVGADVDKGVATDGDTGVDKGAAQGWCSRGYVWKRRDHRGGGRYREENVW